MAARIYGFRFALNALEDFSENPGAIGGDSQIAIRLYVSRQATSEAWLMLTMRVPSRLPRRKRLRQNLFLYLPIQCWGRNLCRWETKIISLLALLAHTVLSARCLVRRRRS